MNFKTWFEGEVLAHISGASGSGKTTLGQRLSNIYPNVIVKDLDEFDDEAVEALGWQQIKKKYYTNEMISKLAALRQKLMDEFVNKSSKPIVFVGHHT
jgi:adenylate kinase family enzyme